MRKTMLMLACLLFSATEVTAQWQEVVLKSGQEALLKSGREMIYSTTEKVVAETGTHAAANTVLTSSAQALIPMMQLAPVLAFEAYVTSLPRVDLSPAFNATGLTTAPETMGTSRAVSGAIKAHSDVSKYIQTYAPGGLVGMTKIPAMSATLPSTLQPNQKRSLLSMIQRSNQQKKAQRLQQEAQALAAAKQDLPRPLKSQTSTVSSAELLAKLPDVQHVDPPAMSVLLDQSKLAEAVKINNPDIPIFPFLKEPGFAYRGMAVAPQDIVNFFTPGVGIERRLTEASNRLNMSLAAGSHGAMRYFATHKVLNLSASPQHAQFWGANNLTSSKPILVVVRVKGNFGNSYIINHAADIMPEEIDGVVALLEQDGHPRWFDVRATQNGNFQITPYELMYK